MLSVPFGTYPRILRFATQTRQGNRPVSIQSGSDRGGSEPETRGILMGGAPGHWIKRTGRLQATRAFIENNLEWGGLTPANAARALGISVRQLHLLFEPTGTTFSRYVLARRLERARLALADGPRRKVLDIAFSCGIESSTVFYRAFRDAYSMNPTDYRRSLRERDAVRTVYSGTAEQRPEAVPLG
jgi:AraC-like DNA-binding protein